MMCKTCKSIINKHKIRKFVQFVKQNLSELKGSNIKISLKEKRSRLSKMLDLLFINF